MTSDDLRQWQIDAIRQRIVPMQRYFNQMIKRLTARGFPREDQLFRDVLEVSKALHQLSVDVHYLGCKRGVGPKTLSQPHDQP
jgi:hypothetical protein